MKSIFSVDVEDWYHILDVASAPKISDWDSLPSYVEKNFMRLLDMFSEEDVHVTCFFLAWIAERYPNLVTEASRRGHEIASHGYSHRLVFELGPDEFFQDALRSKRLLEDQVGRAVIGYRSAGFSNTEDTPWFLDKLVEAGYRYDSSVFPARRGHGGLNTEKIAPYAVGDDVCGFVEFPITVAKVVGIPVCFFGGGYLRFFPYTIIKRMASRVLNEGRPVIFYVHPREIDPGHPRLPMSLKRRFKSYVNLSTTRSKILKILRDFEITTFETYLKDNASLSEGGNASEENL